MRKQAPLLVLTIVICLSGCLPSINKDIPFESIEGPSLSSSDCENCLEVCEVKSDASVAFVVIRGESEWGQWRPCFGGQSVDLTDQLLVGFRIAGTGCRFESRVASVTKNEETGVITIRVSVIEHSDGLDPFLVWYQGAVTCALHFAETHWVAIDACESREVAIVVNRKMRITED